MVKDERLGDSLCDINLAFKAIDASVCSVCLSHDSTDAASDRGYFEQIWVHGLACDCTSTPWVGFIAASVIYSHSFIDTSVISLLVNRGFEQHIVWVLSIDFVFFWLNALVYFHLFHVYRKFSFFC